MYKKGNKAPHNIKLFLILCFCFSLQPQTFLAQEVDLVKSNGSIKDNRWRGKEIIKQIMKQIKDRYYDPTFHGIDIDARFEKAKEDIEKAEYNGQIFGIIAQLLIEFNDSHTRFFPPSRANRPNYGFVSQMIGSNCFVTRVEKDSDAEKKGLKVGEVITSIGDYKPTRNNLSLIIYILYHLNPQEDLSLTVLDENDKERKIELKTDFKSISTRRKEDFKRGTVDDKAVKCVEINSKIGACKLYSFSVERSAINKIMKFASKYENFIFDLRGNSGGLVSIEEYLVSHFFDEKVKIGDFVTRKKTEERIAKPEKDNRFTGKLTVLIDSKSASASEVFARVMQIERRGKIVGDVSAGAVMTSNLVSMATRYGTPGNEIVTPFLLNLTIGDLIMSDGTRLEGTGVIPDVLIGPNGKALSEKRDPILAYAAQAFGAETDGVQAGKFGFMEIRSEEGYFDEDDN
jgi:C-terminal processing protease CtpA/Prc